MSDSISNRERQLSTGDIRSLITTFAIPAIISNLVSSIYNIADQIFIGQSSGLLGNAATNVAFPLTIIIVGFSLLIGVGSASNFNLEMGRKNYKKARSYIANGIVYLVILGFLMMIITLTFLEPLLLMLGATEQVLPYAITYTRISALGFPFSVMIVGGGQYIRADGSPKYAMFTTLSGAILNIILNPIFIFTFNWGIGGAALATIIGQALSAFLIVNYFRNFKMIKLQKSDFKLNLTILKTTTALGSAAAINQMAMALVQTILNNTLTHYGSLSVYGPEIPLAVVGVISKVNALYYGVLIGIAQGIQPIIGYNYGALNYQRVKETLLIAIKIVLTIGVITFTAFQMFPRQIISIFGHGDELYYQFGVRYLRIFLLFTAVNGIQLITSNFFTSIGKSSRGIFLSLTRQVIFLLPLIIFLPLFFGIDGVVFAGPIADFIAISLSIIFLLIENRIIESKINKEKSQISEI